MCRLYVRGGADGKQGFGTRMRVRRQIVLVGALLLGLAALSAVRRGVPSDSVESNRGACCLFLATPDARPMSSTTNGTTTVAPAQQIIAYYFHGTIRCHTCLEIEQQAKAVIERQFKMQLDAKELVFKPVDYQQPENAHFLQDYKLPCPSLVLVRQREGKDEKWQLLGDTWQLIHDPVKFNRYIETEVNKYLGGGQGRTNSNSNSAPSTAPDHR